MGRGYNNDKILEQWDVVIILASLQNNGKSIKLWDVAIIQARF